MFHCNILLFISFTFHKNKEKKKIKYLYTRNILKFNIKELFIKILYAICFIYKKSILNIYIKRSYDKKIVYKKK